MGLEVEAVGPPMERVLPYLEYEALMESLPASYFNWRPNHADAYLEREGNFETLSPELQTKLLEMKRPNETIQSAWTRLPYETQVAAIKPSRMPLSVLSYKLANLAAALKVREDAPPAFKEMMSRFALEPDAVSGPAIFEFKHNEDIAMTDPVKYLADLASLSGFLGIQSMLDDPLTRKPGIYSYHVHISKKDGPIVESVLQALNFKRMLDLAKLNSAAAFSETSTVAYQTDIRRKGLIRRIAEDRVELRYHDGNPVDELRSTLELLSLPEKEAASRLSAQVAEQFTPELIEKITEIRPDVVVDYLLHIYPHLTTEQKIFNGTLLAAVQSGIRNGGKESSVKRRFVKSLYAGMASPGVSKEAKSIMKTLAAQTDPSGVPWAQNFVSGVFQSCALAFKSLTR